MSFSHRARGAGLAGVVLLVLSSCGTSSDGTSPATDGGGPDAPASADDGGSVGPPASDATTGDDADATTMPDATGGDDSSGGQDAGGDDATLDAPPDQGASDAGDDSSAADGGADTGPQDAGEDSGQDAGCVPKTCADLGAHCGTAPDGCGGAVQCGMCPTGQTCGATQPNVCGGGPTCTGLCLQQQQCPSGGTTSVSGRVYAPNGVDPLPGALVYVPNAPVTPFAPGVSCSPCGAEVSGSPLVQATSNFDGTFTIANMPVGTDIPLVIQKGRWRRQMVIPNVPACVNTALPTTPGPSQTRLPQTKAEGDIPLMGFVTGSVDALECVLRKVGVADSEFSDPTGSGRVRFYRGAGGAGATYSASTPDETTLWGTQAAINQYDMVYFACQGSEYDKTAAQQQVVINYANAGGRLFTTHYSYVWLYDDAPFSQTASWSVSNEPTLTADPQTAYINTGFARGMELAQWLQFIGASTTLGQIRLAALRDDFSGVVAPSDLWLTVHDSLLGNVPMHYTFDTPVGVPSANQCGRVLYNDYHVEDAENTPTTGSPFPKECTSTTMTPQEKLLEYAIFDLGECVAPPTCTPKTCDELGASCGPQGDGCGNILQCGSCSAGQTCGGGGVPGACGSGGGTCTPKTCNDLGMNCGSAADRCGGTISCGTCNPPSICGGGGQPNVCGGGS